MRATIGGGCKPRPCTTRRHYARKTFRWRKASTGSQQTRVASESNPQSGIIGWRSAIRLVNEEAAAFNYELLKESYSDLSPIILDGIAANPLTRTQMVAGCASSPGRSLVDVSLVGDQLEQAVGGGVELPPVDMFRFERAGRDRAVKSRTVRTNVAMVMSCSSSARGMIFQESTGRRGLNSGACGTRAKSIQHASGGPQAAVVR